MKTVFSTIFLLWLFAFSALAAPGEKPVLSKAAIEITAQSENTFLIRQVFELENVDNLKNNILESVFSKPDGVVVANFTLSANGQPLVYQTDEKTYLSKINLTLPSGEETFSYQANYLVELEKGVFTIPLLVPGPPTLGRGEIISLDFTAPAGNYIHENSFPIISNLPPGNRYATVMNNIPTHVQYVYGPAPSPFFNIYSIISLVVFAILLALVFWGFSNERKTAAKSSGKQGGKA